MERYADASWPAQCSKCFLKLMVCQEPLVCMLTDITIFDPHNNSVRQVLSLSQFHRCGKEDTERLRSVLQLVRGVTRTQT